jgi:hypothetical protein
VDQAKEMVAVSSDNGFERRNPRSPVERRSRQLLRGGQ